MIAPVKRPECTLPMANQCATHRTAAVGFVDDLAKILKGLSLTARAKVLHMHLVGDDAGMGAFLNDEMLRYRANRGNG